jgi:PAS domain S-box-containing protein
MKTFKKDSGLKTDISESQAPDSSFLEMTEDLVWAVDKDYCLVYGNHLFHERTEKYSGKRLQKGENVFSPPNPAAIVDEWKGYFDRVLNNQEKFKIEVTAASLPKPLILEYKFSPFFSDKNQLQGVVIIGRDITDRKQVEGDLRFTRYVIDNMIGAAYQALSDGQIVYANKSASTSLGYTNSELLNMNVIDLEPDFDADKWSGYWKMLKEKKSLTFESFHKKKNGRIFPVELQISYLQFGGVDYAFGIAHDISERKKTEYELQASEIRFRSYFELPIIGIAITSPEKGWIEANQALCNMLGYSTSELSQLTWAELTHPDDLAADLLNFDRILSGEIDSYTLEKRFIHKNGDIIWTILAVGCVRKPDRTLDYTVAILQNITRRKLIEHEMLIKERAIETSINAIAISDLEGTLTYVNPSFIKLWEYNDKNEIVGRNATSFWQYPQEAGNVIYELQNQGGWSGELTGIKKNNSQFTTQVAASMVTDEKTGHPFAMLASFLDITDHKAAVDALKESEEKFAKAFHNSPDVMIITSINEGKIFEVNESIYRLSGYKKEEVLGKTTIELELWGDVNERDIFLRKLIDDGIVLNYETRFRKKSGELFTCQISAEIIEIQGQKCMLSNIHDISELKKAELIMRESEARLRELNATKDKFFSIIAHDLKSPFNSILGFSEILKDEVKNLDIGTIAQYASIINSTATNTYQLLENLLEWSLSQQQKMPFDPAPMFLNHLINAEIQNLKHHAGLKNIELTCTFGENIIITADENMLSTIIRNLITNAIKFTEKNGKIVITARVHGNEVEVSVADTGIGIKPEAIDKLFKIETSFTTRGTENEKGTGLGLLLCKEFIEKHHGKIWVESEPGNGSRFIFVLPVI